MQLKVRQERARAAAVTTAMAAMVAAALTTAPAAFASPSAPADPAAPSDPGAVARLLKNTLGSKTAGSYLEDGRLVVTVTGAKAAQTVRAAGAVPKTVARSDTDLKQVMAALKRDATVPGTAWAIDPATNQVLLTMDSTVKGAKLKKVKAAAAKHGAAVRTERVAGKFQKSTRGGEAIWNDGARCSLGFNVRNELGNFFLTAGHCTSGRSIWTDGSGRTLGRTIYTAGPGNDYGVVGYTSPPTDTRGTVSLHNGSEQDIFRAGNAVVGQTVYSSGSTTGLRNGQVTAVNQTVTYKDGTTFSDLVRTTLCIAGGDSGGAMFASNTALGIISGGVLGCVGTGTSYHQPVTEALDVLDMSVY